MTPASDIGEGDRRRMLCARFGARSLKGASGLWTRILKNFFGLVDHDKLLTLVNQRVSDGRVLRLIGQMLKAGCIAGGKWLETGQGTAQGGVVSPILSNILLTPFDWGMRKRGYRLTRYADDWGVTWRTRVEAQRALVDA